MVVDPLLSACLFVSDLCVVVDGVDMAAFGSKINDIDFANENSNPNTRNVDPSLAYQMQTQPTSNIQQFDEYGHPVSRYYQQYSQEPPPLNPARQFQPLVSPPNPTNWPRQAPQHNSNSPACLPRAAFGGTPQQIHHGTSAMAKTREQIAADAADKGPAAATQAAENIGQAGAGDGQVAQQTRKPPPKPIPDLTYAGKIYKMPDNKKQMVILLTNFIRKCEETRVKNQFLMKQNEVYRDGMAELQKAAMKCKKNKKVVDKIKEIYKSHLFRKIKFIQDEIEEGNASLMVYNYIYPAHEQKKLAKDHKIIWCNTYAPTVTSKSNGRRSYIQARLKDASMKFAKENGYLPTMEDIRLCAMRTIDIDNKDGRGFAIMKWYWTEVMRKCSDIFG